MEYIKSPLNYIGNKYRIISQLEKHFPKNPGTMVDLFCGGCDVSLNTRAGHIIANDINFYVIDIFREFQDCGLERTLQYIDDTIKKWRLSKTDGEAYLAFRDHYNATKRPLDLYILMCFSFNYQFRFNSAHEYNNPFGANRSSFNNVMRGNMIKMFERLSDIEFVSKDFTEFDFSCLNAGDFVYADPPYLLTCGSYNDGKRGFKGWTEKEEYELLRLLDELNGRGIKFALSNVALHKGRKHEMLLDWKAKGKYHIHKVDFNYNNCNYHTQNKGNVTREVLVTNY